MLMLSVFITPCVNFIHCDLESSNAIRVSGPIFALSPCVHFRSSAFRMATACHPSSPSFSRPITGCAIRARASSSALTRREDLAGRTRSNELLPKVEGNSGVEKGWHIDKFVLYQELKRCIAQKDLALGTRVHVLVVKGGCESDTFLANHLIRMYASHGKLEKARQVLSRVPVPDTFMWCSIVSAHVEHGQPIQAINLYRQMRQTTVMPNSYVFVAVLKACAAALDLATGKEVHADIRSSMVECDQYMGSCLVDMYAKCGSLEDARSVFDTLARKDVVTWTAMIAGYAQHGLGQEALALYANMQQEGMILANNVTYVCLLQACTSVRDLHQGKRLHAQIEQKGLGTDMVVGSCLVDMYAKCGSIIDARRVFDGLSVKNVVSWNVMIAAYVEQELGLEALKLYACMKQEGLTPPDHVTFMYVLQACAAVGALQQGKELQAQIRERGLESNVAVGSCLVDMYAKCGSLKEARRVFDSLPTRDVVTWTALLNGYAGHSYGQMALQCFKEMQQQGVKPDDVTFNCLLVACSHEGLVNEGKRYFKMMVEDYRILPTVKHYVCMVDLLGRSGHLDEAEDMLRSMPFKNDVVGWTSLLSACKSHGDIERGRRCFDNLVALEPQNSPAYVLLANLYASAGRWGDVDRIESLRKSAGAWKKPGKACIEVKNEVHEFTVGDDRADVSSKLRSINSRSKGEGGHVPQTELVLKAVSQNEKEDALCGHAEKLALAYGLLNTPDGTTLLVTKNLRMCNDCHSSTKIMSHLEKRQIVVRDAHRVHHFLDGSCSCGDRC